MNKSNKRDNGKIFLKNFKQKDKLATDLSEENN